MTNNCTTRRQTGPVFSERRYFFSESLGHMKKRWYFCKNNVNEDAAPIPHPRFDPSFPPGSAHQEEASALHRTHGSPAHPFRGLVFRAARRQSSGTAACTRTERDGSSAATGAGRKGTCTPGSVETDASGNVEADYGVPPGGRRPGRIFLCRVPAPGTQNEGAGG